MKSIKKDMQLLKKLKKYFKMSIWKIVIIEILLLIDIAVQTLHPLLWGNNRELYNRIGTDLSSRSKHYSNYNCIWTNSIKFIQ